MMRIIVIGQSRIGLNRFVFEPLQCQLTLDGLYAALQNPRKTIRFGEKTTAHFRIYCAHEYPEEVYFFAVRAVPLH